MKWHTAFSQQLEKLEKLPLGFRGKATLPEYWIVVFMGLAYFWFLYDILGSIVRFIFFVAYLWAYFSVTARRLRSMNINPWWSALLVLALFHYTDQGFSFMLTFRFPPHTLQEFLPLLFLVILSLPDVWFSALSPKNAPEETSVKVIAPKPVAAPKPTAQDEWAAAEPLFAAVQTNDLSAIYALLQKSPRLVNSTDPETRNAPLHIAAANGCLQAATFLLQAGANPALENNQGQIPSEVARANNHPAIAELCNFAKRRSC